MDWSRILKSDFNIKTYPRYCAETIQEYNEAMRKKPKYIARAGEPWTRQEVVAMRELGGRTPTRVIGLKLRRPVGGIKKKAREIDMSLKPINRSPRTRLKK